MGPVAIRDEIAQEDFDKEREIHGNAIDVWVTDIYNGRYDENEGVEQTAELVWRYC